MRRAVHAAPELARAAPAPPPDPARPHAEANRLHQAFFGRDARPVEVRRRYASALGAARIADCPRPGLTRLMEREVVLSYMVEVRPDYFHRFVNDRSRFAAGVLTLGLHVVRSACKAVKGRCLLWIYHVG